MKTFYMMSWRERSEWETFNHSIFPVLFRDRQEAVEYAESHAAERGLVLVSDYPHLFWADDLVQDRVVYYDLHLVTL